MRQLVAKIGQLYLAITAQAVIVTGIVSSSAIRTVVKKDLLYVRSIGSGDDPYVTPSLPPRGLVARDSVTGEDRFTITDARAFLSPNRRHFYSIRNDRGEIFDASTGEYLQTVLTKGLEPVAPNNLRVTSGISPSEQWYYEVFIDNLNSLLSLRFIDLQKGELQKPITLLCDGNAPVQPTRNAESALYLQCSKSLKRVDLDTQQITSLDMPPYFLNAISPDERQHFSLSKGQITVFDSETHHTVRTLALKLQPSVSYYPSYRLFVSRDGSKIICISRIMKSTDSESGKESNEIKTYFEFFATATGQLISSFGLANDLVCFEFSDDAAIMYTATLKRNLSTASIDTICIRVDTATGSIISQFVHFNEVITELLLVPS
jgi:hypothetical protein